MTDNKNLELPNENPDIGKEGPVAAERASISLSKKPKPSLIPVGIAGVWHSHKKQGMQPMDANVQVPGATYAMIVNGTDDDYVSLLLRTDIRDASGQATSMLSIPMHARQALAFLNENFVQTRFRG
jgi:hypothetical protein